MQEHLDTKRILAAALKQLTCRKSFDKITIADITQQSGYNRQTFYYHFRDKYELLNGSIRMMHSRCLMKISALKTGRNIFPPS